VIASIRRQVQIVNPSGLHLRAAAEFVRHSRDFEADVHVALNGRTVDGKSILDLITLAAECGARLEIEASGPDAEQAVAALCDLVASDNSVQ